MVINTTSFERTFAWSPWEPQRLWRTPCGALWVAGGCRGGTRRERTAGSPHRPPSQGPRQQEAGEVHPDIAEKTVEYFFFFVNLHYLRCTTYHCLYLASCEAKLAEEALWYSRKLNRLNWWNDEWTTAFCTLYLSVDQHLQSGEC